jgi:hypothetical protein
MSVFLVYPLLLFVLFYMEVKKKTLHDIFAFNSNSPHIEHITKKNYISTKKN